MDEDKRAWAMEHLKRNGYKMTLQRYLILDVILENECYSCKEIYYKLKAKKIHIGIATVYRMINQLQEVGIIEPKKNYKLCYEELHDQGDEEVDLEPPKSNGGLIDYHDIIDCIASALDAKDPYTGNHSKRVSGMAKQVGQILNLPNEEVERVHIAAHLHDIGKIGVPDYILNKQGKLTKEEWKQMREHPAIGASILDKSTSLKKVSESVRYHHERYDGRGYPEGIKGERIPLGARIIAICDSIDAMCTGRSYREALSTDYCYDEIKSNLGIMYDPSIGEVVLKNWKYLVESKYNQYLKKLS